jgi:ferritin-like metal-binding protein YciE
MTINSAQQLLAVKLQQIEDVETEASRALDAIRAEAQNPEFKDCLERRQQEGQAVVDGVREALSRLSVTVGGVQDTAARGIIEEARTFLNEVDEPQLKEAVAIGSVQALEHYCIATWGTVKALAREMGADDVVQTLERALDSGKRLDSELTRIAESRVNPAAAQQGQPEA